MNYFNLVCTAGVLHEAHGHSKSTEFSKYILPGRASQGNYTFGSESEVVDDAISKFNTI